MCQKFKEFLTTKIPCEKRSGYAGETIAIEQIIKHLLVLATTYPGYAC